MKDPQLLKQDDVVLIDAAQINVPCQDVDAAARVSLEADGFGPGYDPFGYEV